jgi:hypothetical protein
MNIKNLKSSVSLTDFIDDLCTGSGETTLGALWEKNVDCNHCKYREQCHALGEEYDGITCDQVVDYLLGDFDLAKLGTEVEYNG